MCGSKGWPVAEITNKKEFENWLKDQPNEWAQVLAARIALRNLPLASRVFDEKGLKPDAPKEVTFFIFRATSISWVARKYPTHNMRAIAAATTTAGRATYAATVTYAAADA